MVVRELRGIIAIPYNESVFVSGKIITENKNGKINFEHHPITTHDPTLRQLLLLSKQPPAEGDYVYDPKHNITAKIETIELLDDRDIKICAAYPAIADLPVFTQEFMQQWATNPVAEVETEVFQRIDTKSYRTQICLLPSKLNLTDNNEVICHIPEQNTLEKLAKEFLLKHLTCSDGFPLLVPRDGFYEFKNILETLLNFINSDEAKQFFLKQLSQMMKEQMGLHFTADYLSSQFELWKKQS